MNKLISLVKSIRNKVFGEKLYSLDKAAKKLKAEPLACKLFLEVRQYIKKEDYGYSATGMGVDFGYVVNDKNHQAKLTERGFNRLTQAFRH